MSGMTRDARLLEAIRTFDTPKAITLLDQGANPNQPNLRGWTPLHDAAYQGNHALLKALLQHGANPDAPDSERRTPLHLAAGDGQMSADLLAAGADVNAVDRAGRAPLHYCADFDQGAAPALLAARADPNAVDDNGETALHAAVDRGKLTAIQALLAAKPDLEKTDCDGTTPLLLAVKRQRLDIVEALLKAGANPNRGYDIRDAAPPPARIQGESPIHFAVLQKDPAMLRLLLQHGADPDATDKSPVGGYRRKPLHIAVERGDYQCLQILLDAGANVNARDAYGRTPAYRAVEIKDEKATLMTLRAGTDPDLPTVEGKTVRIMSPQLVARVQSAQERTAALRDAKPEAFKQLPAAFRRPVEPTEPNATIRRAEPSRAPTFRM